MDIVYDHYLEDILAKEEWGKEKRRRYRRAMRSRMLPKRIVKRLLRKRGK